MDELCYSIRIFRECQGFFPKRGKEELPDLLDKTEECAVDELCHVLLEEMKAGLGNDMLRKTARTASDLVGSAPLSRTGHFVYGILDLIQQFAQSLDNGKIHDKVVKLAAQVAQESPHSFLRCKAFAVLIALGSKAGATHTLSMVTDMVEKDSWPTGLREKVIAQWRVMRRRALDMEAYYQDTERQTPPDFALSLQVSHVKIALT